MDRATEADNPCPLTQSLLPAEAEVIIGVMATRINHKIIEWARKRAQIPPEVLNDKLNKKYSEWERGETSPTFKQATDLAKKLHIPFGYLFLSEVPEDQKLTADLRTRQLARADRYSPELQDVIADATRKQDWYKDYLSENGSDPLPFVGRYTSDAPAVDIARNIVNTLKLDLEDRKKFTKESMITYISKQSEAAGICVLRNGKVGFNTHRLLNPEEFSGFALPDPLAPFVFVNTADFYRAQVFTIIHELAHIWLNAEGVSDTNLSCIYQNREIEKLCDQVAAEILVPENMFKKHWSNNNQYFDERIKQLQNFFKVSSMVIVRRAFSLELLSENKYSDFCTYLKKKWKESRNQKKNSGANFNNTFQAANSLKLTNAVLRAVGSGETLYLEGARLLGVRPTIIANQANRIGLV